MFAKGEKIIRHGTTVFAIGEDIIRLGTTVFAIGELEDIIRQNYFTCSGEDIIKHGTTVFAKGEKIIRHETTVFAESKSNILTKNYIYKIIQIICLTVTNASH